METKTRPSQSEGPDRSSLYKIGLPIFTVLLLTAVAAYWSILNNTLAGDDFAEIKRLYQIPATELWRLFSVCVPTFIRPVPYFMYWFQYRFFGLEGLPSHLINVGLHAGSSFLLFWFLARNGIQRLAAFMAAALFLLTPLAPEAVSWSDGRFDSSVLFFIMLTLGLYTVTLQKSSRMAYAGALLAAVAAFLSKESAVILLLLIPTMELMFSIYPPASRAIDPPAASSLQNRIRGSVLRVAPFFVAIGFFFILRFPILGGLGGYKEVRQFGMPNLFAPARTILTLLAPLDRLMFPRATILVLATCVGILYLIAAGLVVIRWKQATGQARRVLLILLIFFISSLFPVYSAFFIDGMSSYLVNSRFFYVPNLAFITLMVVGLYAFGWRGQAWRTAVTMALALLLPVYFWGLNHNNRIWERTAAISYEITTDLQKQLPDPPQNAIFYFQNVPLVEGAHFYANGLPETVTMIYNRPDIKTYYVDPEPVFRVYYAAVYGGPPPDGYLFSYDTETGRMLLVRGPLTR